MADSGFLAGIKELATIGTGVFAAVKAPELEAKQRQYELKRQELAYQTAREQRAAVEIAAAHVTNVLSPEFLKKAGMLAGAALGGGLLAYIVARLMGIR